jgi:phage-related protein
MARQTFTWFPDVASENSEEPSVNVTKFGDGYEARTSDTLNVIHQSWRVVFTKGRNAGEGLAIRNFLRARRGVESFIWTNPLGETSFYVARKWTTKSDRGEVTVSTQFDEVFEQ